MGTKRMSIGCAETDPELLALLERGRNHVMTPEELAEQRVSFAYGQMMDCAPHVTKEQVRARAREVYGCTSARTAK